MTSQRGKRRYREGPDTSLGLYCPAGPIPRSPDQPEGLHCPAGLQVQIRYWAFIALLDYQVVFRLYSSRAQVVDYQVVFELYSSRAQVV